MGFILSVCIVITMFIGILSSKNRTVIKPVEIAYNNLPPSFDGYKIAHISDLHLGGLLHSKKQINNLVVKLNTQQPDLVLFTGDLVNNFSYETEGLASVFKTINHNIPRYSILGNHDYGNYSNWKSDFEKQKNFNAIVRAHEEFGFFILRNENAVVKILNDSIFLIGVENWGHPPFPQYADLEQALNDVPENAFQIVLSHDPAHWESVLKKKKNIDLTLSGHTHGMQWGIKSAGIPFSLSYLVRNNWAGLYRSGTSYLYVNQGFGTVGLPIRIDMPPEITLITLKASEVD